MIRSLLKTKRQQFKEIVQSNDLRLDYKTNKAVLLILKEVFLERTYADYFPFYEAATIVDIGAHYGFFTLFAAKNTDAQARIYAFEPATANFKRLQNNLKAHDLDHVVAEQFAVSDQNGMVDIYLGRSENNSIFQRGEGASESVPAITLAEIFNRYQIDSINFLKMDCEGAEYPILFQLPENLFQKIQTISLEFHDLKKQSYTGLALSRFLQKQGYQIVKFNHGRSTQNNNYGWIIATRM